MRWNDIDFQVLLEISHMLSNIRERRNAADSSSPGAPVNSTEHDVVRRLERVNKASSDDDTLQFDSIHDQRFTDHTEAACFVQKDESRSTGMFEVNDQGKFSNPSQGLARGALREALANVRVEHE